jgi:2-methylcitrate dehydratase
MGLVPGREVEDGCLVWGTTQRTTPEIATLINSTSIRFLDFNDRLLGGHPSDNIPAVLAACESSGADIADFLAGVLVNYEVFGELGRLIVRDRGWDQGTTSVVASACAAGRAMRLTTEQLGNAIAIAVTSNIATRQTRRGHLSMWKGVASPYAAQCGLLAASLARQGMTGPEEPFDGANGFAEQVLAGEFNIEGLGHPDTPHYIHLADLKYWPIEFNAQNAVWLGRDIRDAVGADDIQAIEVETYEWAWRVIGSEPEKWEPSSRETADHSLPYALAVAVLRGELGLGDFNDEAIADERTRRLMSVITVAPADDLTALYPVLSMRALVTTRSGDRYKFESRDPRGHHNNPMTEAEVFAKFRQLASTANAASWGESLLDTLSNVSVGDSLNSVVDALAFPEDRL